MLTFLNVLLGLVLVMVTVGCAIVSVSMVVGKVLDLVKRPWWQVVLLTGFAVVLMALAATLSIDLGYLRLQPV